MFDKSTPSSPSATRVVAFILFMLCGSSLALPGDVAAFPWDIDMYRQPSYQPGEMVRAPAPNTRPLGRAIWSLTTEEASTQLENPTEIDRNSLWRGRRVWNTNCNICHGESGKGDGRVGTPLIPVPNLLEPTYLGRTDGHIYGTLMNGGALMPRYGYKLSEEERWDVVNYLRFLQGREFPDFPRPEQ